MNIDPRFKELIDRLETSGSKGHTIISSILLDLPLNIKEIIIKSINDCSEKNLEDSKIHDFTIIPDRPFNIGLTIMTSNDRVELRKQLDKLCILSKYQAKIKQWLGLGRDVTNENIVDIITFDDSSWKENSDIDNYLKANPSYVRQEFVSGS